MNPKRFRHLIFATVLAATQAPSFAAIITLAPPPLRVYTQPACPGDGYIWTPGYWAYGPTGYYWVPGSWLPAPHPGYLYTPGYWAFVGGGYAWHRGYWGLHVGYYGGVNYGFGYTGSGFHGGHWDGGHFFYNRKVANVDERRIHNIYREETHGRGRADIHTHEERRSVHEEHSREEHSREHPKGGRKEVARVSRGHSGGGHPPEHHKRG